MSVSVLVCRHLGLPWLSGSASLASVCVMYRCCECVVTCMSVACWFRGTVGMGLCVGGGGGEAAEER